MGPTTPPPSPAQRCAWVVLLLSSLGGCDASVTLDRPEHVTGEHRASPVPETPTLLCSAADLSPEAALLSGSTAERGILILADGSQVELDIGAEHVPADAHVDVVTRGVGDHLVSVLNWRLVSPNYQLGSIVSMFDAHGNPLFQQAETGFDAGVLDMNGAGEVLITHHFFQGPDTSYLILRPDGSSQALGEFFPSEFAGDGYLRGSQSQTDGTLGWLHIDSHTFVPATSLEDPFFVRSVAGHYIALDASAAGLRLWRLGPGTSESFLLPDVEGDVASLDVLNWNDRWLLLLNEQTGDGWRISTADGTTTAVDLSPPSGPAPEAMSYCAPDPVLTTAGGIITLGGEDPLVFELLDPEGATWTALADPISQIETVGIAERDGTYLLESVVGTFCPGVIGEDDSPGTLVGATTQLVRPSNGFRRLLDAPGGAHRHRIRPGGDCVINSDLEGTHIIDLAADRDTVIADHANIVWWTHAADG